MSRIRPQTSAFSASASPVGRTPASTSSTWRSPLDLDRYDGYDRHARLTESEELGLAQALAHCEGKRAPKLPQDARRRLARLLQPLDDILAFLGVETHRCVVPVHVMLLGLNEHKVAYWAWSEEQWISLFTTIFPHFVAVYVRGPSTEMRRHLVTFAYLLGPRTNFFLQLFGRLTSPQPIAWRVFSNSAPTGSARPATASRASATHLEGTPDTPDNPDLQELASAVPSSVSSHHIAGAPVSPAKTPSMPVTSAIPVMPAMPDTAIGKEHLREAVGPIADILRTWGYKVDSYPCRKQLANIVAEILLANRSPYLQDLTFEFLLALQQDLAHHKRATLGRVSRALAHLRIIDQALPTMHEMSRVPPEQIDTTGIAPEWAEWCMHWHRLSDLDPRTKRGNLSKLLRAGRWLAQTHPEITTPHQWTIEIAAEFAAAIREMREGDFRSPSIRAGRRVMGKPLAPVTQRGILIAMRCFFRDLQELDTTDFNTRVPRRFDPVRAFRTPQAIKRQIGPNPRDLDPLVWARLVHAALELAGEDLPHAGKGVAQYPLAMVRAIAATLVYSGLRSDEITRLPVGCIRWQRENVRVPESGEMLPKDAVCFLTVPVNKTSGTFQKPVNPVVGHAITEWEKLRKMIAPNQPLHRDRKTGVMVDYLFAHRGRTIGKEYINTRLIPMLCEKAGIPRMDERGAITGHRARATLATLLYNAPEGLSIFDLMQWLGHKHVSSTQHYARVKPTRLASAYVKAERNSRLVEALVDTKAEANGDVRVYYVLGEQGLCGNPEWASCQYRMACIKCPFFVPRDRAQLVEASKTVKRFMEVVELTDEELAAVQDDHEKLQEALGRSQEAGHGSRSPGDGDSSSAQGSSAQRTLARRARGANTHGIPLTFFGFDSPVFDNPVAPVRNDSDE
ncbi:MAG: site-specific integrase [Chloroflexota bacterium]